MNLICLVVRTTDGLLLQPTTANLVGPSIVELPPRFVANGTDAGHIPFATLEGYIGQTVGLDLLEGTITTYHQKKK